MTKEDLVRFRTRLEDELVEVSDAYETHRKSLSAIQDAKNVASGDWPQELENVEVEEHVVNSEELYLEKIRSALGRIDDGTFGSCQGCGREIPIPRLEAKPCVALCLTCQERKEGA